MADQKNRVKILENKSEIGAGTRGASLGVDSLKVASLNSKSSYFFRHESIVLEDFNSILFVCGIPRTSICVETGRSVRILLERYNNDGGWVRLLDDFYA